MALYAFDGTLNFRDRKGAVEKVQQSQYGDDRAHRRETVETNVHRFRELYGPKRTEYLEGVGTRYGVLGAFFGGTFGLGGKWRVRRMYKALSRRYFEEGDHDIDVVGFSRGAALAVHFCNVIERYGLRSPENRKHLFLWYHPGLGLTFRFPKAGPNDVPEPEIRFLGLWDMVASFGLAIGKLRNWSLKSFGLKRYGTVPEIVTWSYHAMALDEVRATFELVRPRALGERKPEKPKTVTEVWFRGVHSNVGGGYLDRGLSDIALAWMMEMFLWVLDREKRDREKSLEMKDKHAEGNDSVVRRAFERALLKISPVPVEDELEPEGPDEASENDTVAESLEPDANGEIGRPPDVFRQAWRQLPLRPLVHHSVYLREPNLVSDHHRSNRRLLRIVPHNAQPIYDPPYFYPDTPSEAARKLALDLFRRIPIRPQPWIDLGYPKERGKSLITSYRSDAWAAVGRGRGKNEWVVSREGFTDIASKWLLAGRPEKAADLPPPKTPYQDFRPNKRQEMDATEIPAGVLRVLRALEQFVPALWRDSSWSRPPE